METGTCRFMRGDIVRLVVDADTEYLVLKVYPSALQLTKECKYDLLKLPRSLNDPIVHEIMAVLILTNIPESQIRIN